MLSRLQAAFERQRQFVADASHELRTPLTIINLETSRVLASRRSEQEYQRALNTIRSENNFMTHVVSDLLTLARMDSGQARLNLENLDLSDVTLEAVERLASLAERRSVCLETGELPEALIQGDRQLLLQMVSNLVENGIKYSSGSEMHVQVETGAADGKAWVRVSDNGPGIPPEHLEHIFDRFYQVDKARTHGADQPAENEDDLAGQQSAETGSGLGLAIVQSIVRLHGGSVRVESTPGTGTVFEVSLASIQGEA
jgi:two-component system OmpR family sensor kinase